LTNREIYDAALALLAEQQDELSTDYEERAPYLIAAFCSESATLDKTYRASHGLPAASPFHEVFLDLGEDFPLCSRLARAATLYLASMLVIDENSELSDKLFERYSELMSVICCEIPATVERISDYYA
jgi:hypothetical protein